MPKTVSEERRFTIQVTLALAPDQASELRKIGEEMGSQNSAARQIMNDWFNWYGLPTVVKDALKEDAKRQKIDQREYVTNLLMACYDDLRHQHRKDQ